jgi:hypothetical protein
MAAMPAGLAFASSAARAFEHDSLGSSWLGIAVRRTASLRSPMSRPSTPYFAAKTWMPGTRPGMTVEKVAQGDGGMSNYRQKLNLPPACTPTLENSSAMLGLMPFATSKSALLASTSPFISLATPRP